MADPGTAPAAPRVPAPLEWAAEVLGEVRATMVKDRPWARVWRLEAGSGVTYLKAPGPGTRHEGAVLRILAGDAVPQLVATHPEGWLITADAGPVLRERVPGWDRGAWERLLLAFARLQRSRADRVEDLLAAGVPDERPERLPDILEQVLAATTLDADQRRTVRAAVARLTGEAAPLPSIQHGDLHDGNVLDDGERLRFIDFGDSSVAHPFTVVHVALVRARDAHGISDADADALVEAYLSGFTDLAAPAELRRTMANVRATAPLLEATAWLRALSGVPAEDVASLGDPATHALTPYLL